MFKLSPVQQPEQYCLHMSDRFCPLLRNSPSYSESSQRPCNILRSLYNHSIISLLDLHHYQSQLLEVVRLQPWTLYHHASHTGFHVIPLTCEGQLSLGLSHLLARVHRTISACICACLDFWASAICYSKVTFSLKPSLNPQHFSLPSLSFCFAFKNVFLYSTENVLFIYHGASLHLMRM